MILPARERRAGRTLLALFHVARAVRAVEVIALVSGVLGIAALTVTNVLLRSFFGASLYFAEEVSRFLIVLVTFAGLGYAAGQGRHIRMTALYDALPKRTQKALMLCITGGTSLLLLLAARVALAYVFGTVRSLGAVTPVLHVPKHWVYLIVPVGLLLGAIQYALAFAQNLLSPDVYLSFEQKDQYESEPPSTAG